MHSPSRPADPLTAVTDPPLRPLPERAVALLRGLGAPPRLAAHLRLVHDVAYELADWMERRHPGLPFDRAGVLFGAATHDIGKITHPGELSGPGSAHEEAGRRLLLEHGVGPEWARFAGTHAAWAEPGIGIGIGIGIEDLLVSLADKVWKNKRVRELEDLVVGRLTEVSGRPAWEEFLALDDLLEALGADADRRLAFQATYPVHPRTRRP
ncbi:HD domain-containing protein [Streptomyces phaeolivaceus]|uniref:HD domain-containing protein n=1 Tax=Streptomyces phaeolivaceus TaxID=2653200 RepID=A0A5P8K1G3_9ACTN|nr:HD domain-containing protein [Streptomyces phaeolivaceus]QFQ97085.1 HD domain-containing protein [Streptomyces phaeolivaceus]